MPSRRLQSVLPVVVLLCVATPPLGAMACSCGPPLAFRHAFFQSLTVFKGRVLSQRVVHDGWSETDKKTLGSPSLSQSFNSSRFSSNHSTIHPAHKSLSQFAAVVHRVVVLRRFKGCRPRPDGSQVVRVASPLSWSGCGARLAVGREYWLMMSTRWPTRSGLGGAGRAFVISRCGGFGQFRRLGEQRLQFLRKRSKMTHRCWF